jgi:putative protease
VEEIRRYLEELRLQLDQGQVIDLSRKTEIYMALPHVTFMDYKEALLDKLRAIDLKLYDGFLIRTLGQTKLIAEYKKAFVTDYNIHGFNQYGLESLAALGAKCVTLSPELNLQGLNDMMSAAKTQVETLVYGSLALMHSANCVYQNRYGRCNKTLSGHNIPLRDRKGMHQQVLCHCQMCYNTIYNQTPLYLLDERKGLSGLFRLEFINEKPGEMTALFNSILLDQYSFDQGNYTRGHFKRGVK